MPKSATARLLGKPEIGEWIAFTPGHIRQTLGEMNRRRNFAYHMRVDAREMVPSPGKLADLVIAEPGEGMQPLSGLVVHRMRRQEAIGGVRAIPQDHG